MSQLLATALNITLADHPDGGLEPQVEGIFILEKVNYRVATTEDGQGTITRTVAAETLRFTASPDSCRAAAQDLLKFADLADQSAARWRLRPDAREAEGSDVCEQIAKWVIEEKLTAEDLDEELDDLVHGIASKIGSDRNNGGTHLQIDFLLENGFTRAQILTHVHKKLIEKES